MKTLRSLTAAALICGGAMLLSGCQHDAASSPGTAPLTAPHAAPPVQAQISQVENNPHIPAAQKAAIEAQITARNSSNTPASKAP